MGTVDNIGLQISIIEKSIDWAAKYKKDSFPADEMKEYGRLLKKYSHALSLNCSAAAYGESQVGKSYLISSLLSSVKSPFVIINNDKEYSFIDELNPSGGNVSKTESTGLITRFTIHDDRALKNYVHITNLSVSDLLMLLTDSYYNDLKTDVNNTLQYDAINAELDSLSYLWKDVKEPVQTILDEDDIKDICDYAREVIGSSASGFVHSDFRRVISNNIKYIEPRDWDKVFGLMWNRNAEMSKFFGDMIEEYGNLKFQSEVYVPFDAVLRSKGSLLSIEWLDGIFGNLHTEEGVEVTVDVFDHNGTLIARNFSKSFLAALAAEVTMVLPERMSDEREFLKRIDLLDFPGARSREKFDEAELSDVLPQVLRRGKVAYLFNKYSRSLLVSSVLFCHHNDQKTEPTIGETINDWIAHNIGSTPEERTESLLQTKNISPLFFIATKFNIELQRTKMDSPGNVQTLNNHWKRFSTVIPEIINPAKWFEEWSLKDGHLEPFRSIYLLRDFYWSGKANVFDGYIENSSEEKAVHRDPDYPDYFENLRKSFMDNQFVRRHFQNPLAAWESAASLNNDGSKPIIEALSCISGNLEKARDVAYRQKLVKIRDAMIQKLFPYYVPEDNHEKNEKAREICGDIRLALDLSIGQKPEIFGHIIDKFMIPASSLRKIAYDIVILKTETPRDFNEAILIRRQAGIDESDDRTTRIDKLCRYYACSEEQFTQKILEHNNKISGNKIELEDIISDECSFPTTVPDLVSKRIMEFWTSFINRQVQSVEQYLPHSDEVAFTLHVLARKLGVDRIISDKIGNYYRMFQVNELPNAIADFAALALNNFVSSVGWKYMSENDIAGIKSKADSCGLLVNLPEEASNTEVKSDEPENGQDVRVAIINALHAFDEANDPISAQPKNLERLPFWNNFKLWKDRLAAGILYVSDISECDPVANAEIKDLIDNCKSLYKQ